MIARLTSMPIIEPIPLRPAKAITSIKNPTTKKSNGVSRYRSTILYLGEVPLKEEARTTTVSPVVSFCFGSILIIPPYSVVIVLLVSSSIWSVWKKFLSVPIVFVPSFSTFITVPVYYLSCGLTGCCPVTSNPSCAKVGKGSIR
jgi:hypothetical protein